MQDQYQNEQFQKFFNDNIKKPYNQRKNVLEEFYQTEQNYVEDLQLICEIVIPRFEKEFNEKEILEIFINIKEIIQVNKNFFNVLTSAIKIENQKYQANYKIKYDFSNCYGHENSKIFEIFSKYSGVIDQFSKYFDYCKNYMKAANYRQILSETNPQYNAILIEVGKLILERKLTQYKNQIQLNRKNLLKNIIKFISKILRQGKQEKNKEGISVELIFQKYQKQSNKYQKLVEQFYNTQQLLQEGYYDLNLENYLSKPFQRISKYILLLSELKKNTPTIFSYYFQQNDQFYHPDYDNIDKLLQKFQLINQENDKAIGDFENLQKMVEIQQKPGNEKFKLLSFGRKFILEEHVELVIKSHSEKYLLVCFNDSIILINEAQQGGNVFAGFSIFSEIKQTKILPQQLVEFQISTQQKIIQLRVDEDKFENLKNKIQNCITECIQQKRNLPNQDEYQEYDFNQIQVRVQGREIINFTYYIITLQYQGVKLRLYKSLCMLSTIQRDIKHYDLDEFKELKTDLYKFEKQEDTFNAIEQFILYIFRIPQIITYKRKILFQLGIPLNFNQFPKLMQQQISIQQNMDYQNFSPFVAKIQQDFLESKIIAHIFKECILFDKENSINELKQAKKQIPEKQEKSNPFMIKIYIPEYLTQKKEIKLDIVKLITLSFELDYFTQAIEICQFIADKINLLFFNDFRLVIQIDRVIIQYLNNEDFVYQALNGKVNQTDSTLTFKKIIFFPSKVELQLYQQNDVRLNYLIHYFFTESKNLNLSLGQYSNILALLYLINEKFDQFKELKFDFHLLDFVDSKTRSKYYLKTWEKLFVSQVFSLSTQFVQIQNKFYDQQKNKDQNQNIQAPTIKQLAQLALMNIAYSISQFRCHIFNVYVNINQKQNIQWASRLTNLPNVHLGISFDCINFFSPINNEQLYSFPLSRILKVEADLDQLFVQIQIQQNQEICNNTENSNLSEINKLSESIKNCSQIELKSQDQNKFLNDSIEKIEIKTTQSYRIMELIQEYQNLQKQVN